MTRACALYQSLVDGGWVRPKGKHVRANIHQPFWHKEEKTPHMWPLLEQGCLAKITVWPEIDAVRVVIGLGSCYLGMVTRLLI